MGQTKLIHEHFDSKPWASIISGSLLSGIAILKLIEDRGEHSWLYLIIFGVCLLPTVALLVMDIIWKVSHNEPRHRACSGVHCVTYPHYRGCVPRSSAPERALAGVLVGHFGGIRAVR